MGKKAELVRKVVKSPDFWVRVDAIGTGVAVIAESVLLGFYLHSLPLVLAAAGAVAAPVLLGCGLYSIFVGTTGTVNFLKNAYKDVFNKNAAPAAEKKPGPTLLQRLARHPSLQPLVKKLSAKPLVQKFLNSPVGKLRRGLTQPQRDLFMVSLNMKGSLFVGGTAAVFLAMHMLALPALTIAGVVTTATAVAAFYMCKSLFDITCSAKVLFRHLRDNRAAKKAARNAKPVPAKPPPLPAAKLSPSSSPILAFAKSGAAEAIKKVPANPPATIKPPPPVTIKPPPPVTIKPPPPVTIKPPPPGGTTPPPAGP